MSNLETQTDQAQDRAQVLRAAGIVSAALLLSRMVGLLREMFIRSSLGVVTIEATAFDIAKAFPEAIFMIIAGGAIGSAFIPTFAAYFTRDDEIGAWRLFSAIINLITITVTLVALAAMLFAQNIVLFFYGEKIALYPELLPITVRLMRIMLISPIIFGASGVIMGALNARQHFLLPALAPTVYNLGIIAGGLIGLQVGKTAFATAVGLAIGTVIGASGHLLIQLPALRWKHARYTAVFTLRDPGVIQVIKLMIPRVLGLSFNEINTFIRLYLTGSMLLGSLPALNAAFRLIILPQGIIGQALGIAAFPTLSTLAAKENYADMRIIVTDSLRLLLFLGLPVTVLLIMLREPIIRLLFERGLFGSESTELVVNALYYFSFALVGILFLEVLARSFYALSDTFTPVLAGMMQVLMMTGLSLWLLNSVFAPRGWVELGALALGYSISNYLEVAVLLILLRRKLGRLNGREFVDAGWRMGVAAALMVAAMGFLLGRLAVEALWAQLILGTAVGLLVYVGVCWLLRVKEVMLFWGYGRRLLLRSH